MIVVVSRTIIIKAISIPIIQNRIESECHFLIILFLHNLCYGIRLFFIETYPSHLNN